MLLSACSQDPIQGPKGEIGQTGKQGSPGENGINGHSVVFTTTQASQIQCVNGGTIIIMAMDINDNNVVDNTDSNIQTMVICNGQNGMNGKDAPISKFTPVKYITPCGPNSSLYKEVLLLMGDGSILASFSENPDGKNIRLALIPDGTYQDTDSSECIFTITTNGNIRSISWNDGGESWEL